MLPQIQFFPIPEGNIPVLKEKISRWLDATKPNHIRPFLTQNRVSITYSPTEGMAHQQPIAHYFVDMIPAGNPRLYEELAERINQLKRKGVQIEAQLEHDNFIAVFYYTMPGFHHS